MLDGIKERQEIGREVLGDLGWLCVRKKPLNHFGKKLIVFENLGGDFIAWDPATTVVEFIFG